MAGKVAIVGSRDYPHMEMVRDYVYALPLDTEVVSGGARGVDKVAEMAARDRGMSVMVFEADWTSYGRSAGMRRNARIVQYADRVVAFWDGKSRGTADTIGKAGAVGKLECVYGVDGEAAAGKLRDATEEGKP